LGLIEEGLRGHSFLATDRTLDHWREYYWVPEVLSQEYRGQWEQTKTDPLEKAWKVAQSRIRKHQWELEEEKVRELEAIVGRAREDL
jgi:trimethylamine:corrinoid methyltransferase-like protein